MTHLLLASGRPQVLAALAGRTDLSSVVLLDLEPEDGPSLAAAAASALGVRTMAPRELVSRDLLVHSAEVVEPAASSAVDLALNLHEAGCPVTRTALPGVSMVDESLSQSMLSDLPSSATSGERTWSLRAALRAPSRWDEDQLKDLLRENYPGTVPDREAIAALRDTYRGQTCVIIGNGPSLNQIDFALLKDVPTFGVNSLFLASDRMGFDPTFYVVEDTAVMEDNVDDIRGMLAGDLKLFPSMYRKVLDGQSAGETVFFSMNRGFYSPNSPNYCTPRFSTDASAHVYAGQSVTIVNLQLAYHLGFSRVCLVGMDFSYVIPDSVERQGNVFTSTEDDPNHFDPRYFGAGKKWKDPQLERVRSNYELARAFFEADGREIVNSTVGGQLEVFPRLELSRALAGESVPSPV